MNSAALREFLRKGSASGYDQEAEVHPMKTITIEIPEGATLPFAGSDEEFGRELRLAAAIFWYDRGVVSQGKGAEIAGLSRAEFIDALGRANVSAIQTTVDELKAELEQGLDARR
jgi:predicted HTH domain antitoxin